MEFEWQTRAPGDASSPFYQLAMEHERQNKKRPHSIFDSPQKPATPALRDPNSQPFLFSRPAATTGSASSDFARSSAAFATPRKVDLDFSSGPENDDSPCFADNDETPEPKARKRDSLFNFYGRFAPPSPGRGEIAKSNKFSNVLINRVKKRRRRDREMERHLRKASEEVERQRLHDDYTAQSQSSQQSQPQPQPQPQPSRPSNEIPFFSRLFTFLESHPHIPRILSYYAQFAFNLTLAFLTLYVIVAFLLAIRSDVIRASDDESARILAEMAVCARNYVENRCGGENGRRLPALETVCENWERCMNQDPAKVGRAKVSAQTLAEIFNGFIEPISLKTMIFMIASLTSFVAVSNFTFSFFRTKSNYPPHPDPAPASSAAGAGVPPNPFNYPFRPFTPPAPSQLAYSSARPFGMDGETPYFAPQSRHFFSGGGSAYSMSPTKGAGGGDEDVDGARHRRIEYGEARTSSPVKNRGFS
ncbi:hypothetical protein VTO42DRAFT_5098 [Malbranchea cinnamomea]